MEWPHFLTGGWQVNPSICKGPGGLGDWNWMPRFRTTTWQVPGSTGFLGSGRKTKHHLWECNMIDCCSHYPVDFLKPLRARARQSQGDTEEEVVAVAATAGGETIRSSRRSAVQSPWSPLQLSSSAEFGKQAAKRGKQPKETLSAVFFSSLSLHWNSVKSSTLHGREIELWGC